MTNTLVVSLLVTILTIALIACSQTGEKPQSTVAPTEREDRASSTRGELRFNNANWDLALAEAKGGQEAYLGSDVDIRGQVAQVLMMSESESQFTIETKTELTFGERTLVVVGSNPELTESQWVRVRGALHSYWNTENLLGAELRVPVVAAQSVAVIARKDAFPSIRSIDVDESITQYGLTITLQRVEIAETETRLYVHAMNNSLNKASLYAFDAVLVQGTHQIMRKEVFGQDVVEPDSTLVAGTETEGVLLFDPVSPDMSPVTLIWENPRTDDYSIGLHLTTGAGRYPGNRQ